MEFVNGLSLAQHIDKYKCLREHEALSILLPVADALTYMHNQQIIHRDIKPANILMGENHLVKLADMGLIKDLDSDSRLTRANTGLGTVQFSPPEQFNDASSTGIRGDIYSLAATILPPSPEISPLARGR